MGYQDVLNGTYDNHLLPFLWMKGEGHAEISEYLEQITKAGIGAVCLESRPHPDFCGDGWWRDLAFTVGRCHELGLKVWILDDSHFPTGYANGAIARKHPDLAKKTIAHHTVDIVGPCRDASIVLAQNDEGFHMLGATALHEGHARVLSTRRAGNRLFFDIEEAGVTRVSVIGAQTSCGFHDDYINMVDKQSCDVLIEEVLEPHFEHMGDEFGKTILGFFSDEPGFMTEKGQKVGGDVDTLIGKRTMPLPWSDELHQRLLELWGDRFEELMTLLWEEGDGAPSARRTFMDVATDLYRTCFEENISSWCRKHGVEHIGHVIEDRGCHLRLGTGAGHFFRAESGMGMAGVDVVMNQLVPGIDSGEHPYMRGVWDMEFYAYELARLGSSAAHLDPAKRGRCLAEVFGAFGWHEGLRQMKAIVDHFLVRGVNYFVPHAFSMAPFPDPDCPPNFYAHGMNPQFRHFKKLADYTNRLATLLSDGASRPIAAVLYQAEATWAGEAMPEQAVARELTRSQIEFDFVPLDLLCPCNKSGCAIDPVRHAFSINGQTYLCLVLPYAEYTGHALMEVVKQLTSAGIPVLAVDSLPKRSYDEVSCTERTITEAYHDANVLKLEELGRVMQGLDLCEIVPSTYEPWLRAYPYDHGYETLWFFVNEHPVDRIATEVRLTDGSPLIGIAIDMVTGETHPFDGHLDLTGCESTLVVANASKASYIRAPREAPKEGSVIHMEISGPWHVERASAQAYPVFGDGRDLEELENLSETCYPDFSGTFCYMADFELSHDLSQATLDLGAAFEVAELWLDGKNLGVRIAPPYRFSAGTLTAGRHRLRTEVVNTLEKEVSDPFSACEPSDPSGLLGPVSIRGTRTQA